MKQPVHRSVKRAFMKDEDGSMVIFGLLLFVLMLTAGGLGVDFMRFEAQRSRLQSTLDRAVLAAASLDQTLDRKVVVMDYFKKAGLEGAISMDDIDVIAGLTASRVDATAQLEVDATFLRFVGINSMSAPATGAAEEAASLTEISLVVDVSGSMTWQSYSGNSKMYELQQAAKKFTSIVLCNPGDVTATENCVVDNGKVSMSLIPYSEQVVLGEDVLRHFNVTREHDKRSCVTFYDEDYDSIAVNTTDELQRTGYWDPDRGRNDRAYQSNSPCKNNSYRKVTLLEGDVMDMRNAIDDLEGSGFTSIDLGMKWGAAFLDDATAPVIQGLNAAGTIDDAYDDRPFSYDQRGVEKVIVLMTDGENTDQRYLKKGYHGGMAPIWKANDKGYLSIYDAENERYWWVTQGKWSDHAYGTGFSEYCRWVYSSNELFDDSASTTRKARRGGGKKNKTWYCSMESEGSGAYQMPFSDIWKGYTQAWYDQWNFLEDAGGTWGNGTKNDRLDRICTAAKAEDITVFTIGFEVPSYVQDELRNCATAPAFNFNVNGLNIADAFATIAREISKLRLVN
ncbi:MAG: TadE/TadG family type IV pilus assembly protein [Maritimibacter sp.]